MRALAMLTRRSNLAPAGTCPSGAEFRGAKPAGQALPHDATRFQDTGKDPPAVRNGAPIRVCQNIDVHSYLHVRSSFTAPAETPRIAHDASLPPQSQSARNEYYL